MIIPIILAGGSGTRLWSLSRQLYPKQLIRLKDDNTLLQNTLGRLQGLDNVADPMVICHQDHRFMKAEQIREINVGTAVIILEPAARNTAPAINVTVDPSVWERWHRNPPYRPLTLVNKGLTPPPST